MKRLPFFAAVVVVLLLSTHTVAEIKCRTISNDSRRIIMFRKFRIVDFGHVTVSVSSASVSRRSSSPILNSSKVGFFAVSEESFPQVLLELQQNLIFCVLDSHYIHRFFTFFDLSRHPRAQFNQTYPITYPSDYSLFFANCAPETKVSMKVETEIYNIDRNGSKDYSPAGSTQLPGLYLVFSLCYLAFLGFWLYFCWNNKQFVTKIHLLMSALPLLKCLSLISVAGYTHCIKVTGTSHGCNIVFHVLQFINVVSLFMVIVLLGSGWSFLNPKLRGKEKILFVIIVLLQVLANIVSIVAEQSGNYISYYWLIWIMNFWVADTISWCAIMLAMCWPICCQRETSKTNEKKIENLERLQLFSQFYVFVIGYLYFPRVFVIVVRLIVPKFHWVGNAVEEFACLAFYIWMFYMFRPMERMNFQCKKL